MLWYFWLVCLLQAGVALLRAAVWSYWWARPTNRRLARERTLLLRSSEKQESAAAERWYENLRTTATRMRCESTRVDARNPPEWYDAEKWRRAQQVVYFHYTSQLMSSVAGTSTFESQLPGLLIPIVRNGKTTTVTGLYHRFINSFRHEMLWCTPSVGDPFDRQSECYKSLEEVRHLHEKLFAKMNRDDPQGVKRDGVLWVNQYDMVCTQFAIIGIGVAHPTAVGLHSLTAEEWDNYLYVWRVVGHCMGIEDQYNLFSPTCSMVDFPVCASAFWRCKQIMQDESSVREDPQSAVQVEYKQPEPEMELGFPYFNTTSMLSKPVCDATHQVGSEMRQIAGQVVAPMVVPLLFGWHPFLYYWHEALGWPQDGEVLKSFAAGITISKLQYYTLRIVFEFVLQSRDGHSYVGPVIRRLLRREFAAQSSRAKELNRQFPPKQLHWKIQI